MLKGSLTDVKILTELSGQPFWQTVFDWLCDLSESTPNGIHEISGRDIYANVMEEPTTQRESGVFEAHRQYLDLHYCIFGDEIIEYADPVKLKKKTEYDTEKDVQLFFMVEKEKEKVTLSVGDFVIFHPGEAHAPRIRMSTEKIKKVVVKIKKSVLVNESRDSV